MSDGHFVVKPTHGRAGFFSCCTMRLHTIIEGFNERKMAPTTVDSSAQFQWYKPSGVNHDICHVYFHQTDIPIVYTEPVIYNGGGDQYAIYKDLKFDVLNPFIDRYFAITPEILSIEKRIKEEYGIDYDNTCVLFHRGNDKAKEVGLPTYEEYIKWAEHILERNPAVRFLIQSDETEFIQTMEGRFSNSVVLHKYIRHIPKRNTTVDIVFKSSNFEYSKYFLAITLMMSKCKSAVLASGNCPFWVILLRQNAKNIVQFKDGTWISTLE